MFLGSHQRSKDGKDHRYWSLVESVRTRDGPRQRTLCYLGELDDSAQGRWLKAIEVFNEQGESRQLKLFPSHGEAPEDDPNVAPVLLNKVWLERTRQFGNCFLGLELWKRLGLDGFGEGLLDQDSSEVRWSRGAAVLAIHRWCAPSSELAVEERWDPATALDDLRGIPEGKINDTRLYRCLDHLLPQKSKLEQPLRERYGKLFQAQFDVLLDDLTSTYIEGAGENHPLMQRGYSRDHRPDCKQAAIARIVNLEGFPLSYEGFDGHRAEVTTLETVLRSVERKTGKRGGCGCWIAAWGVRRIWRRCEDVRRSSWWGRRAPNSSNSSGNCGRVRGSESVRKWKCKAFTCRVGRRPTSCGEPPDARKKRKPCTAASQPASSRRWGNWKSGSPPGQLKDRPKRERQWGRIQARHPQGADL